MQPRRPNFSETSKAGLGICLILGSLVFVFGAILLGMLSARRAERTEQGLDVTALDQQMLVHLAQKDHEVHGVAIPAPAEEKGPLEENKPPPVQVAVKPVPPVLEPAPPAPAAPVPPPGVDQKRVDAALDKGVQYLKSHQNLNGTWGKGAVHAVGYAALPGLTLLECGVSPKDPVVQKAAAFVRTQAPRLISTYELSLAILFLDRLGEPRDKGLIKGMALRLVAGQTAAGGWNYTVPLLPPSEMDQLMLFLERTRPSPALPDPIARTTPSMNPLTGEKQPKHPDPVTRMKDKETPNPLARTSALPLPSPLQGPRGGSPEQATRSGELTRKTGEKNSVAPASPPGGLQPFDPDAKDTAAKKGAQPAPDPKAQEPQTAAKAADAKPPEAPMMKAPVLPKHMALRPDFLPANLQNIPAVMNQGKGKGKALLKAGRDDNSNSQFAMLALWTARRHGVPTDRTLLLAYQRYVATQAPSGGWAYMVTMPGQTPSMTCVGLLGLAMGHGSSPDAGSGKLPKLAGKTTAEDPAIQKGLAALGSYIGRPSPSLAVPPMENLYFLWSVERVAMLYNLKTIGGKDWYRWGAQILLPNQAAEGSWHSNLYHGSAPTIDTCFALLFLKRSNLVQDLTDNLQLLMAITDPEAKKK